MEYRFEVVELSNNNWTHRLINAETGEVLIHHMNYFSSMEEAESDMANFVKFFIEKNK